MGNTVQKPTQTSSDSTFICMICHEVQHCSRRFNNNRCTHNSYCVDCIANYIQAKLDEYNQAKILCPNLDCKQFLDPISCQPILPARIFVRWCGALCERSVLRNNKIVYCPYRNCSALILNECECSITKSKCPQCRRLFCLKCVRPWHNGYTCDEIPIGDRSDIVFQGVKKSNNWKSCPSCAQCIEHKSGCRRVRCRCGVNFCYLCGEKVGCCKCIERNRRMSIEPVIYGMVATSMLLFLIVFAIWQMLELNSK